MHFSLTLVLALAGSSVAIPLADQSSAVPTQPGLQGALSQVNATHVQFTITNPNEDAVSLLSQHNILHPGAEHLSLQVRPAANNSQVEPPGPGDGAVRYIYSRSMTNDSFLQIPAKSQWTHTFDITRAFKLPAATIYDVSLNGDFRGVYSASGQSDIPNAQDLHPIRVECQTATFQLAASAQTKKRRASTPPDSLAGCASTRDQTLATIKAAAGMASDAVDALNNVDLLKLYFGLVNGQTEDFFSHFFQVQGTYGKIAAYDPTKDTHITWNCAGNPGTTISGCRTNTIGFYVPSASSINLCQLYTTLPPSLGCTQPSTAQQALDEQVGTVLHELTHDFTFSPQDVIDFPDPFIAAQNCYNYNCATKFATDRSSTALPERSAINLEQFAQAVRFTAHPGTDCVLAGGTASQTPPTALTAEQADSFGDKK